MSDDWPRLPVGDLQMRGEVDIATTEHWSSELRQAVLGSDGPDVVADMSGVSFIDASGVQLLLDAQRDAHAAGKRLVLHSPSPCVVRVLDLLGLADQLPVAPAK